MFTEADYREYFTAVQNCELAMLKKVSRAISMVSDPEIREKLDIVRSDEVAHARLVQELFSCIA